jgi:hypothetical protein
VFADFTRRVQAYTGMRSMVARTVPPLEVSTDPTEIWHASNALAFAIRAVRADARQGDLFSPEIAVAFRVAISAGCHGRYDDLLEIITDELESPLPAPTVHARWPMGAPLPMMPPDLLAALPTLPAGLEYRFMNRDLVLLDVDANLIIDFVPGAVPSTTSDWTRPPLEAGQMQIGTVAADGCRELGDPPCLLQPLGVTCWGRP